MVEPDKKDLNKTTDLEDTVRNLREENAKLLQLLRSQGLLLDPPNGRSSDSFSSTSNPQTDTANITFDHSDLTLTNTSVNTTNQISHQQINNHGPTNQQNYNEQTIHGNQSNIAPNFNTVIQSSTQPFVQNNSNTLVQNNTNLIQPINLVNFNNVSLDSIQSFFAAQNSVVYLSQTSATTTTTTTTTTTSSLNSNLNESIPSNTQSILPLLPSSEHPVSIRPKPSMMHQHQELVPVIPKMKSEYVENLTKQSLSNTSNNDTTNLLDNDSNDPKQKYPRPIRPKPSSRAHSLQNYKSMVVNESRPSSFANNSSPTVSLFSSPTYSPSTSTTTTSYLSQTSIDHQLDHPPQIIHSKSVDLSVPSTANKKSNKTSLRKGKKPASASVIIPPSNQTLVPIAPNLGRPLAPAPANVQRNITSNNPITKRTNRKVVKRNSKSLVQSHSESILQATPSSPSDSFAESISGLLENFDQELIASNFLSQATVTTTTTSNLLSHEVNSLISSNTNIIQTLENIDPTAIERQESYHPTNGSMPTMDEFNVRLEHETVLHHPVTQDFNVEGEQITSFMSEEDMRLVEMNFDENTFLKQFDLEDAGIKLSVHTDQNLFANILTANNDLIPPQLQQQQQPTLPQNPPPPPPPVYSGSSLINNNVFTTVVPLGLQRQTSHTNTLITNSNVTRLLPEEGVQLTARHIEPSQVATYESSKYQDILDDLVMVTDQDVLSHAQAAAAADPSVVATDFSFALIEATNEMIKNTNIEITEATAASLTELQYFYPIEQEQELLQQQLEDCHDTQQEILHGQQPIVVLEKLRTQMITSTNVLDDSVVNTSITDLSSILQFQSIQSPSPSPLTTELVTPIRPTKTITSKSPADHPVDFDSLLPSSKLSNSHDNDPGLTYSPISDTLGLSSNSLRQQLKPMETTASPKPCILFEPISSSSNPSSPLKSPQNEMIIDSGRLDDLQSEKSDLINHDQAIEDLLRDTTNNPYEIIENQGQTLIKSNVIIDDVDQLIEQIEHSEMDPKRLELLEHTFSRYQEKYQLILQRQQEITSKQQSQEQSLTIPPVKLKLTSIYTQNTLKNKDEPKSPSPPRNDQQDDEPPPPPPPPPVERPSLKITIRTKLPTSIPLSEEQIENKRIRKAKKKKAHHHNHQHHNQKKAKIIADKSETEYAGLTRFEQPLAQLYHQQSPPTSDETLPKDETHISSLPLPLSRSESQSSTTIHSGFMIDEQTPPSSITSNEHKQSPPPLLLTQTKTEKLKINYSHVFNYDNNHEHQNNDTFVTPPPEIELNLQHQKSNSYENFCSFSNSPNKRKHYHRKSSVTSSSSCKSLTNMDYAIDTEALEPVSPTPLSTAKQKHSQNSSANFNDISPSYFEHQQQRQAKDYHSKKSSSSNRSSRPTSSSSSQIYPQSRSLSNHNHRAPQEPPLIPPILPPPPPPMHLDPYAQSYHHPYAARVAPAPFFNFPFPHPYLNPHSTTAPTHFHPHHSMKYPPHHHHHHHPSHDYSTHQQQYSYHPHLQRQQQQYNNSNYMSSRDHHSFDR